MDGFPRAKTQAYNGTLYSDTRYFIIKWLEKELPTCSGSVLNVSAGGWVVPKQLLDPAKVTKYATTDIAQYGDSVNHVDVVADVHSLPSEWSNAWDVVLDLEALECYEDPRQAVSELYRVLKPGGVLLLSSPFNYRFFGAGTGLAEKVNPVKDYWRFTRDGLLLLTKGFAQVQVNGFGGEGEHDRYTYCLKAIK